jgi:hypothetical protein
MKGQSVVCDLSLVKTPRREAPCESGISQTTTTISRQWFQDATMLHSVRFRVDGVLAKDTQRRKGVRTR